VVEESGLGDVEVFGLTANALELIRGVFRRHPQIRRAVVFGSRAMGCFENNSDIDLALWGDLDLESIGRIASELDELPLPYTFDVKAYESIHHVPLRRHIDEFGKTLYVAEASSASR
jgi:predicted nucleotidyltransferase